MYLPPSQIAQCQGDVKHRISSYNTYVISNELKHKQIYRCTKWTMTG